MTKISILRIKPDLMNTLEMLGASGIRKCFDCGVCTVTCPFSEEYGGEPFPRKVIKYVKLGVEDKLVASLEPWLCYHCGDCSDSCPKGADPSEILAAARRYLIIKYDFTGRVSRFLHLTKYGWLIGVLVVATITLLIGLIFRGPIITDRTMLETFAPVVVVDTAGLIVFALLALFLLLNIYRMYRFTVGSLKGIPLSMALRELVEIPKHFFTQVKLSKCSFRKYHFIHLMIFYGYALSFLLFVVLLRFTLTNEPFLFKHPLSILGIISTILLLIGLFYIIKGRFEKKYHVWKYSHTSDWIYTWLLALTVASGVLTGIFRTLDYPLLTYVMFALHIIFAACFLVLMVPFGKWSHLAYRPFAIYFARLKMLKERGFVR
ncbi:MAG: 4Fe-4S dicluster domain-containing protein [Sulfolobales archaeon]